MHIERHTRAEERSTVCHASNIHGDNLDPIIAIDVWAMDKANLCHIMVSTKPFICRASSWSPICCH